MDQRSNVSGKSAAYYLLEGLKEAGIEYLFCNFGTDHAPVIEALAQRRSDQVSSPEIVRCAHENTAAHMAGGYALMTGQGQGVLVHVDVGTSNCGNAMHNMLRTRIPLFLMAGRAPYSTGGELPGTRDMYVHFIQEPFDQGSLIRPYVKWEWTLPSGVIVKETLRRAHSVMQSDPKGPVYLMLPRETLCELLPDKITSYPQEQFGPSESSAATATAVDALVSRLLVATAPLIITSYGGRTVGTSEAMHELAEFAGIAVVEFNSVSNISYDGPCFIGTQVNQLVPNADLGLMIDVDVPWFPRETTPLKDSFWAQIDVDVLKSSSPMWTFPSNLRLQGNSAAILRQVHARLVKRANPDFLKRASARLENYKAIGKQRKAQALTLASEKRSDGAINTHALFSELGKRLDERDLIFNEAVQNASVLSLQIDRPLPHTIFKIGGGGLGASGGMALGAKLAMRDRLVVAVMGDGSFYFNTPASLLTASAQYDLPILILVIDNSGWAAVKRATLNVYPDGEASDQSEFESRLSDKVDFGKVAEGLGCYGEMIERQDDVSAALDRCIAKVKTGTTALLHVKIPSF